MYLALLILSTVGNGLMAGLFCSFSNFMMKALADLPPAEGARAMQSINRVILNPPFFAVFFGTAALSLVAVVLGVRNLGNPSAAWALAGGAAYVLGCFAVTAAGNVPLNDKLEAVDADSEEGQALWADYLVRWTWLNHLRSAATLFSTAAFTIAAYYAGRAVALQ